MVKIEVHTHSDTEPDIIELEEYNPEKIADKINTNEYQVLTLGENIYSKIDIKRIVKL